MKSYKKLIYIVILSSLIIACKKGEEGDPGPAGDKGKTGPAGVAGTAAAGDKGQLGDKGITGTKGTTGDQGPAGVANLVTSNWATATWKLSYVDGSFKYFEGTFLIPELTQEIIDKGVIVCFSSNKSNNYAQVFELSPGIFITGTFRENKIKYQLNGFKTGKVVYQLSTEEDISAEDLTTSSDISCRISAIK